MMGVSCNRPGMMNTKVGEFLSLPVEFLLKKTKTPFFYQFLPIKFRNFVKPYDSLVNQFAELDVIL